MRKFLSRKFTTIIAAILAATVAVSAALASPGGQTALQGKGNAKRQGFVQLKDVKGHWAEADILEMAVQGIIRGYPNGIFQPKKPVTHAEAIVMLTEALGLTPQGNIGQIRHKIPDWAQDAVRAAVYAGILTEADLANFRPNQPAKRYEIAVYLVRGSGLQGEGQLGFIDEDAIPVWARVYVALANQAQLMVGEPAGQAGFKFQPQRPVTRAEMAALMVRIQERLRTRLPELLPVIRLVGTVTDVEADDDVYDDFEGSLTVEKADGETVTLAVYGSTHIYRGRDRIKLDAIDTGEMVRVVALDGRALLIRVLPQVEPQAVQDREREKDRVRQQDRAGQTGGEVSGTLQAIVIVDGKMTLTLTTEEGDKTFDVVGNAVVEMQNLRGPVSQLLALIKEGQEVELELKNRVVVKIVVKGNLPGKARKGY